MSHKPVGSVGGIEYKRDRCRMSSIIWNGDTFHGISVFGRGVFAGNVLEKVGTYAGQHRDGYACGLAVATYSNGSKEYAEHGPDGKYDGRYLIRSADGLAYYCMYERGKRKDSAYVLSGGRRLYNGEVCVPDDPRFLALTAQVAPVEVRPAAPAHRPPTPISPPLAPKQLSDAPARFAPAGAGDRRCHRGATPRRTLSLVAVGHNPTATLHPTTTQCRIHGSIRRSARTGGASSCSLMHPTPVWCT